MMRNWLRENVGYLVSAAGLAFLLFMAGVTFGVKSWQPARLLTSVLYSIHEIRSSIDEYVSDTPTQHLRTRVYPGDGVLHAEPDRMQPGVTLIAGLFDRKLGYRLYANDGTLLHDYPIDIFKVAPEEMNYHFHALIHGEVMLENGDIIANLVERGVMRFNACGKMLWRNHNQPHHSVALDDEGYIWTPGQGPQYNARAIASKLLTFDIIQKFDPETGEKLEEIDLVNSVLKSDMAGLAQANDLALKDVFHLNDVEILSATMADAFPMFRAGDILVSSRHFNQIWVLDGQTHLIKWFFVGPMIAQHDPDFNADGTITLIDNHAGGAGTPENDFRGALGGSRILSIDPATKTYRVVYESGPKNRFYTERRGKHQFLENGNLLVTESDAGRVFEVTPNGDVVFVFNNGWDEDQVGWVMGATRYPESYANFIGKPCD